VDVPFIEVRDVSKSFAVGRTVRHVLRGVSLSVERGEFVSIVGAMGSGKSTLLSLIAGLSSPDTGEIVIDGDPVRQIRRDAAFVFQNYSLLPWFTALENVRLAVQATFPEAGPVEQRDRARRALEQVGLGNAIHRRPPQLSGGMRQRVAIARAFVTEPRLLFLDEPFGALDAMTRETLQQELVRLSAPGESQLTAVMITNSVEEALLLSDRIVPMMPGPPASLGAPIAITLERPRTIGQLAHDEQALHMRSHVVATLTASLGRPRRGVVAGPVGAAINLSEAEGR
jgi:ABC-type nitrate/sulfonate/bicarbonate transport system ATPase subunit